ncbi:hypothetical protein C1645_745774 [Glomus cerebriforme]|uniref:DNA methylase N-4/N-6 domain-containing protein n=1 Tax=Glomus cerebriforme TaxID=658196 RepID=A0A397SBD2_9GLOM|nr:hypothetical protein C1645_745774 [Glomus cerebriforme]
MKEINSLLILPKYFSNTKQNGEGSFGNVWEEPVVPNQQRKHPHQKPRGLIRALVEATTKKRDLIVDPCAGSFVVLEVYEETGLIFLFYSSDMDEPLHIHVEYKEGGTMKV